MSLDRYDRDRIVALDTLRHDYVHCGGLGGRLPQGDDDLRFLWNTTDYLLPLVTHRYGIPLDPKGSALRTAYTTFTASR